VLYRRLEDLTGSPIVTVNRAIALAEVKGPAVALALLDELDLDSYQYFHSTRADLLRRLGRNDEARSAYAHALQLAQTEPERRFLQSRLHELSRPDARDGGEQSTDALHLSNHEDSDSVDDA